MREFTATAVAAEELADLDTQTVVLAEHEDGSGLRLEIQRALSFSHQDGVLEQDTYCIATETGATHYGGVQAWRILGNRLEVILTPEAARTLGVGEGFRISVGQEHEQLLREALTKVIGTTSSVAL